MLDSPAAVGCTPGDTLDNRGRCRLHASPCSLRRTRARSRTQLCSRGSDTERRGACSRCASPAQDAPGSRSSDCGTGGRVRDRRALGQRTSHTPSGTRAALRLRGGCSRSPDGSFRSTPSSRRVACPPSPRTWRGLPPRCDVTPGHTLASNASDPVSGRTACRIEGTGVSFACSSDSPVGSRPRDVDASPGSLSFVVLE